MRTYKLLQLGQTNIAAPRTGGQLRNYHLAHQLSKVTSVVHLGFRDSYERGSINSASGAIPMRLIPRPKPYTLWKLTRGPFGRTPAGLLNFTNGEMERALESTLAASENGYDIVQVEGIEMFPYLRVLRRFPRRFKYLVMDWHNIESELMRRYALAAKTALHRWYLIRTACQFRRIESEVLSACDVNLVTSERERRELLHRNPEAHVVVVPNGVDLGHFEGPEPDDASKSGWQGRRRLLYVASMDYHPNIDAVQFFAKEVWPSLQRQLPHVVFTIVGRNPPEEVRVLGSHPGIEVTGTVADVRRYYREGLVAVVPLRVGGGTRLKILEAMAAGLPVVSTALGAEGIAAQPGVHFEIAETAEEFCSRVSHLIADYSRWRQFSVAGNQLVKGQYDWNFIGAKLRALYLRLLQCRNLQLSTSFAAP